MISTLDQSISQNISEAKRAPVKQAAGVIDLCSGLGGLSSAAADLGMNVIAAVDTNSAAIKTFGKNFPKAQIFEGSVRSPNIIEACRKTAELTRESGNPLIVVSGPPCQGFSVAGTRDPKDPRNKVFVSVAHAIVQLNPDAALVENVSMVLSEKYRKRINTFGNVLAKGGYNVAQILLDASDYGVPQRRKRTFFLITRSEIHVDSVMKKLKAHKTDTITSEEALCGLPTPLVRPDRYDDEFDYGGVPNHLAMQHSERVKEKISLIPQGKGPMSYRKLHPQRPSNTLFSGHRAPPAHFSEPRSITVREAARLQGFDDSYRIYGPFGKQMEQVTNAVPPPLARVVLQVLAEISNIKINPNV